MRASVGGLAVTCGTLCLSNSPERTAGVWMIGGGLLFSGVGLIVGFLTPLAGLLAGLFILGNVCSWVPAHLPVPPGANPLALAIVIIAVAIALLGPGAFSLDGYLFGRREVVIPPRTPES